MNMNVNPVGFGNKVPVSRIKMARTVGNTELPVDNYVKEMLKKRGPEIEKLANVWGRDVVLAQRGKLLLVNSGAKTSAIDMSKMSHGDELIEGIKTNIILNA